MTPSADNMTHATSPARCRPNPRGRATMAASNLHGGIQARKRGRRIAGRRARDWFARRPPVARMLLFGSSGMLWPESETRGEVARPLTEEEPR
jgi:hypothetical protein